MSARDFSEQLPAELPDGWETVKVSERYSITKKPGLRSIPDNVEIPFLRMEAVPVNRKWIDAYDMRQPPRGNAGIYFEEGDLLLSRITPCFENGKQGIAKNVPGGWGLATTEVIPIKGKRGESDVEFLAYFLLDREVRARLAGRMEGATGRQRLRREALENLQIPFPPVMEQHSMADVLSKIQRAVELEEKRIAALKELKAATMAKVFREGLCGERLKKTEIGVVPESWGMIRIGDIAAVGNGSTPGRTTPEYWNRGTLPWITSGKVHETFICGAEQFVTPKAQEECHLPLVPKGSIVVAITGQGKTLGNAALLRIDTFVNQHLAFLTLRGGKMLPDFLLFYLQYRYKELRSAASGGGTTKAALTCGFLKQYRVPVPKIEEQEEIAKLLSALVARKEQAGRKQERLSQFFYSALHQLMTGKLRVFPGSEDVFDG